MRTPLLTSLAMIAVVSSALAATPPSRMNYQGVLRDASNTPLGGDHDMVFRFFDAATLGNEILVDRHLAAGTGAVTVSGGLFAVALGSGSVADGSGPGTFSSLSEVFRDHANAWLEVQVGAEVLAPRIQVLAAGYALNADHLDGFTASAFGQRDAANDWTAANSFTNASNSFTGSGAGLTGLNASALASGTVPSARIGGSYTNAVSFTNGSNTFTGSGSGLSGVNATTLDGIDSVALLRSDASDTYTSGTLTMAVGTTLNVDGALSMDGTVTKSSTTLVTNFNADLLDGLHSTSFGQTSATNTWSGLNTFTRTPTSALVNGGSLYVNPATSPDQSTLFGVALGGNTRFKVDEDGDVSVVNQLFMGGSGGPVEGRISWLDGGYIHELDDVGGAHYAVEIGYPLRFNLVFDDSAPGANETLTVDAVGNLRIDGDLQVDGLNVSTPTNLSLTLHGSASIQTEGQSSAYVMFDDNNSSASDVAAWYHDGAYTSSEKLADLSEVGNFRIRGALSQFVAFDVAESFLASEPLEPGDLVRVDPARPDAVLRTSGPSDRGVLGIVSEKPGVLLGSAPFDAASLREVWGSSVHDAYVSQREFLRAGVLAEEPGIAAERDAILALEAEGAATVTPGRRPSAEVTAELTRRRALHDDRLEELALERFWKAAVVPIALSGRVPVKVTGPVDVGDPLGPSPVPGVAMRAEKAGTVIGIALEARRGGQEQVLAFVSRGYAAAADPQAASSPTPADAEAPSAPLSTAVPSEALPIAVDSAEGERAASRIAFTEAFPVLEPVAPGDVVVASSVAEGSLALARGPHDPTVVGVVAPSAERGDPTRAEVVLSGTVLVKADAGYGSIRVGDLLTTSPTYGHAMRAVEPIPGTILGKAISGLEQGTGSVRVLVMPR